MANISQLCALQELLKQPDDEENVNSSEISNHFQTPGHIGNSKTHDIEKQNEKKGDYPRGIWDDDEVLECELPSDNLDDRIVPKYETLFKQNISSEDIFLGMSSKNPSTACCEDIVVLTKVYLPDTKYADVILNVTDTFLDVQTTKYKLGFHFPHNVESKRGKAQWNTDECLLTVTVPLRREYDFLNQLT